MCEDCSPDTYWLRDNGRDEDFMKSWNPDFNEQREAASVLRADHCLKCNTKSFEGDEFCETCGSPLVNRCTNVGDDSNIFGCGVENRISASYCTSCGEPTTFHIYGLIEVKFPRVAAVDTRLNVTNISHWKSVSDDEEENYVWLKLEI
jgi:hypothetical protein